MPDFRLKVFHAVATHLSFTKAAGELFITQPAVSKNIQELESEFKMRLFERKGTKIELTTAGEILLNYSDKIFAIYQQIDFEFGSLKNQFAGQLHLGASTTISQYVLPPLLAKFYQTFPEINLSLISDNTEKIEAALLDHKIELGIVEGKTQNRQLKYTTFLKDELVAVVHAKSRLARYDEISVEQIKDIPFVFRERGSGTLEVIEHELRNHKIKLSDLKVVMYLGSTEGIKAFLENANCMGFVSVRAISKELINGDFKIINIKNFQIKRTFDFVHLQGKAEGLSELFIRFASKQFN